MKAIYKGKKVKVTKIVVKKNEFVAYPMISQVRIEWMEEGETCSDYVNGNEVEFN